MPGSFAFSGETLNKTRKCRSSAHISTAWGRNNVYSLAKFLWSIGLRPIADKLTKDYLVIYGSRDAMACHAGLASSSLYNLTKNRVLPISEAYYWQN